MAGRQTMVTMTIRSTPANLVDAAASDVGLILQDPGDADLRLSVLGDTMNRTTTEGGAVVIAAAAARIRHPRRHEAVRHICRRQRQRQLQIEGRDKELMMT